MNKAMAWAARAAAIVLGTIGTCFLALSGYVTIAVFPEVLIAVVIGGGLVTSSIYLWKTARKLAS